MTVGHVADRSHKSQETPQSALHFATLPRYLLSGIKGDAARFARSAFFVSASF